MKPLKLFVSSSSDEELRSRKRLKTNPQISESEIGDSDYDPDGESDGLGDPAPKSVLPAAEDGSSGKNASKGKETAGNDLKFTGPQLGSSSRSSLKPKQEGGHSKNNRFPRVWSLEDEVTLLNSIHEFQSTEGRKVDTSSIELFCGLLKGRLSFIEKPGANQVWKKIKALKKKYFYNVKTFADEHDLEMKKIADVVWNTERTKGEYPQLKVLLREIGFDDLEKEIKSEEKAIVLNNKLKMQRIEDMKVSSKRLEVEKEILKFNLEDLQNYDD